MNELLDAEIKRLELQLETSVQTVNVLRGALQFAKDFKVKLEAPRQPKPGEG